MRSVPPFFASPVAPWALDDAPLSELQDDSRPPVDTTARPRVVIWRNLRRLRSTAPAVFSRFFMGVLCFMGGLRVVPEG